MKNEKPSIESDEISQLLQNLLQALADNVYFLRMLLNARVLLFGQTKKVDREILLKFYTHSEFFVSVILNPSALLKKNKTINGKDFPLIENFRNLEGRDQYIYWQRSVEKYYGKLPEEKQLKFRDAFSESIYLSIINELSKIEDINILKIMFYSEVKQCGSANSCQFIRDLKRCKTNIINLFVNPGNTKNRIIARSEEQWDKLDMVWSKEAQQFGWPGFFEPRFILGLSVLCVIMAFLIIGLKMYQNPVILSFFLLFGFTLPIHFVPDLRDVRVDLLCRPSVGKALFDELACKGIFLNQNLMPLLEVAKDEEQKKPVIIYKLANLLPLTSSTPQIFAPQASVNFFPSGLEKKSKIKTISGFPNLNQFIEEEKKMLSPEQKICQALQGKGYLLNDKNNVFSPKLINYNNHLVVFNFDKNELEKTMGGLDKKTSEILKKSIRDPNQMRFGPTSESLKTGERILIKGWLNGKHLRIAALTTGKRKIYLGPDLGDIEEYTFTHVFNKHEQTKFFKINSTKHKPKSQAFISGSFVGYT